MKPRLVHNWPNVKEENDELSDRILETVDKYSKEIKLRHLNIEENKNDIELKNLTKNEIKENFYHGIFIL